MIAMINFCYRGILKGIEIFIKIHIAVVLLSIATLLLMCLFYLTVNLFATLSSLLPILS
jgi:hypothetical protein